METWTIGKVYQWNSDIGNKLKKKSDESFWNIGSELNICGISGVTTLFVVKQHWIITWYEYESADYLR